MPTTVKASHVYTTSETGDEVSTASRAYGSLSSAGVYRGSHPALNFSAMVRASSLAWKNAGHCCPPNP